MRSAATRPALLPIAALATLVAVAMLTPAVARAQKTDSTRTDSARTDSMRPVRIAPVHVSGTRLTGAADARVPVQVDVADVKNAPAGPAAAAAVVARLPGVSMIDDQGTRAQPSLDVRGFTLSPVVGTPQGVSVFLDGVRVNEPDAQEVNFDLLPMDALSRAELVRGPGALFGKNSLAGALVLTTQRGQATPDLEATTQGGAWGYRSAHLLASGMASGIDGLLSVHGSNEDGWRDDTPARTRMLFATVGRKRPSSDVALSVLAARDRIYEAGSLPESWLSDPRANYTPGDYFAPDLLQLTVRGERDAWLGTARGNVFYRHNAIDQYNVNVGAPDVLARIGNGSWGGTAELEIPVFVGARAVSLTLGGEASRNDVLYRIYQRASGGATPDSSCDAGTGLCEHARVNEDDAALYAQGVVDLTPRLSLTASARGDYVRVPFRDLRDPANDGTGTYWRLSPRVGASWRAGETVRAFASVSGGFRAPAALELACADQSAPCPLPFALGDDPALRPVTVTNGEAGVDWAPARGATVDLTVYRADVHDEIVFVAAQTTAGYFTNIPRTRRQGVELSARLTPAPGVRVYGSYGFVDATYQSTVQLASALDSEPPARPGDRFPLAPAHRATAGIGATKLAGAWILDGDLSARAVSSQYLRGDEANRQAPLPGYAVAALRLAAQLDRVRGELQVANLLGARYDTFGIFGENPRGPIGGPAPAPGASDVERFLTPGYPRSVTLELSVDW